MSLTVTGYGPGDNKPAPPGSLCGCPRQADWWLCEARPDLGCTRDGRECELGLVVDATDSDYWPGDPIGNR